MSEVRTMRDELGRYVPKSECVVVEGTTTLKRVSPGQGLNLVKGRAVDLWQARVAPSTFKHGAGVVDRWLRWMAEVDSDTGEKNGGRFAGLSVDELVAYQKGASGDERYAILDVLERWVTLKPGRLSSKINLYAASRSLFLHNRADLPPDPSFHIKGTAPPVPGSWKPDEVRSLITTGNLLYRAIWLCQVQGGMDWSAIKWFSQHGLEQLEQQLDAGIRPIRVDLPGRKKAKFSRSFYTMLGKDAEDAIRMWLDHRARYRGIGEELFVTQDGTPLVYSSVISYHNRHLRRLNMFKGHSSDAPRSMRSGKNPHEFRDFFKTRWHLSGADIMVADFLMGHDIDKLGYDKAMSNEDYVRNEYRKASKWLNILSQNPDVINRFEHETKIAEYDEANQKMRGELDDIKRRLDTIIK